MNAGSPAPQTAMILAAGLGTRLRPMTDRMPKALVPFEGVPMIQRLMVRLREAGFTRAVINVHSRTNGTCCATPEAASAMRSCPA